MNAWTDRGVLLSRLSKLDGRLGLLLSCLFHAWLRQARMGDELGKLFLIVWRMKAAIKRGALDSYSQTFAKSFDFGD